MAATKMDFEECNVSPVRDVWHEGSASDTGSDMVNIPILTLIISLTKRLRKENKVIDSSTDDRAS